MDIRASVSGIVSADAVCVMRGFCPKCQEYRSENGLDAWCIIWKDGTPVCERCSSLVDMWERFNNVSLPSVEDDGESDEA